MQLELCDSIQCQVADVELCSGGLRGFSLGLSKSKPQNQTCRVDSQSFRYHVTTRVSWQMKGKCQYYVRFTNMRKLQNALRNFEIAVRNLQISYSNLTLIYL